MRRPEHLWFADRYGWRARFSCPVGTSSNQWAATTRTTWRWCSVGRSG